MGLIDAHKQKIKSSPWVQRQTADRKMKTSLMALVVGSNPSKCYIKQSAVINNQYLRRKARQMGQQNKNHNSTFVVTTIEHTLSRQTEGETDIATDIYRNKTKQEEQDSHIRTDRCKHTKTEVQTLLQTEKERNHRQKKKKTYPQTEKERNIPTDRKRSNHAHRHQKKQKLPQTLVETNIATDINRNKHTYRHKKKQTDRGI